MFSHEVTLQNQNRAALSERPEKGPGAQATMDGEDKQIKQKTEKTNERLTLPETNISHHFAPKNGWLVLGRPIFRGKLLVHWRVPSRKLTWLAGNHHF